MPKLAADPNKLHYESDHETQPDLEAGGRHLVGWIHGSTCVIDLDWRVILIPFPGKLESKPSPRLLPRLLSPLRVRVSVNRSPSPSETHTARKALYDISRNPPLYPVTRSGLQNSRPRAP